MRLGVNIDHIATIRQARRTVEPDPVAGAFLADRAGADSIVAHLREDRRHIQDRDLEILRRVVTSHLNLEMAAVEAMVDIALAVRPDTATLVPERREEVTTEGGLDAARLAPILEAVVARLGSAGIRVSLFIDPDPRQVEAAHALGAAAVELHTGAWAAGHRRDGGAAELAILAETSRVALGLGLEVAAGHGLTYHNVGPVAAIPEIAELNIGHSIIARSVFSGLEEAVTEMRRLMLAARPSPTAR